MFLSEPFVLDSSIPKDQTPTGLDDLSPDFRLQIVKAARHLKKHGWAIVENVLTPIECQSYLDDIWSVLNTISSEVSPNFPFSGDIDDYSSYPFSKLLPHSKGIVHSDRFNWLLPFRKLRQHPKVIQVFAALFGSLQLYASADRVNVQFPNKKYIAQNPWAHVDQDPRNLKKRGLCSVQSYLTLHDVGERSAGNRLYDGSHRIFNEWEAKLGINTLKDVHGDWFKIDGHPDRLALLKDCPLVKPQQSRGSLLLWDSRTVHSPLCYSPGATKEELVRLVCYFSMLPYLPGKHTDAMRKKKTLALNEYYSTRHTAIPQTKFGPQQTYGKDPPLYHKIDKKFLVKGPISRDEALLFHHIEYAEGQNLLGGGAWKDAPLLDLFVFDGKRKKDGKSVSKPRNNKRIKLYLFFDLLPISSSKNSRPHRFRRGKEKMFVLSIEISPNNLV
jgi:hypothetical protein